MAGSKRIGKGVDEGAITSARQGADLKGRDHSRLGNSFIIIANNGGTLHYPHCMLDNETGVVVCVACVGPASAQVPATGFAMASGRSGIAHVSACRLTFQLGSSEVNFGELNKQPMMMTGSWQCIGSVIMASQQR